MHETPLSLAQPGVKKSYAFDESWVVAVMAAARKTRYGEVAGAGWPRQLISWSMRRSRPGSIGDDQAVASDSHELG